MPDLVVEHRRHTPDQPGDTLRYASVDAWSPTEGSRRKSVTIPPDLEAAIRDRLEERRVAGVVSTVSCRGVSLEISSHHIAASGAMIEAATAIEAAVADVLEMLRAHGFTLRLIELEPAN